MNYLPINIEITPLITQDNTNLLHKVILELNEYFLNLEHFSGTELSSKVFVLSSPERISTLDEGRHLFSLSEYRIKQCQFYNKPKEIASNIRVNIKRVTKPKKDDELKLDNMFDALTHECPYRNYVEELDNDLLDPVLSYEPNTIKNVITQSMKLRRKIKYCKSIIDVNKCSWDSLNEVVDDHILTQREVVGTVIDNFSGLHIVKRFLQIQKTLMQGKSQIDSLDLNIIIKNRYNDNIINPNIGFIQALVTLIKDLLVIDIYKQELITKNKIKSEYNLLKFE
jgi:hypothetical protein